MVMEGHERSLWQVPDMPYQNIAAGSPHSSQEHPAHYCGMLFGSVRAVVRAVSEARIGLTAL
jgi:hypothetical protein